MHRLRRLSSQLKPHSAGTALANSRDVDAPLLSAEQEAQFRQEGFVNAGTILEEETLSELSRELDRVLGIGSDGLHGAVSFTPFGSSERPVIQIVNMWEASEAFARVCSHPKIVRIVRQLIGSDDLLVWHDQMQYKVRRHLNARSVAAGCCGRSRRCLRVLW
jgi:hypothetical protein